MEVADVRSNNNEIEPLATGNMDGQNNERSWLKCMMGCKIDEREEVTKLNCLDFLCSDECIDKLKENTESGMDLKCLQCDSVIPTEQLAMKIIPAEIFGKKKTVEDVKLICDHCIHKNSAVACCPKCNLLLCYVCKVLHRQIKATTDHRLENDLTAFKTQVLEEESKCKIHDTPYNSYCQTCRVRICELCLPEHKEHQNFYFETQKETLKSNLEEARTLTELQEKATVEIQKKKEELRTSEYDKVMNMIGENFAVLQRALVEREQKFKEEVTACFNQQKAELDIKTKYVELSNALNEQFIKVGEEILTKGDDLACINFFAMYGNVFEDLETRKTLFTTNFEKYVEREAHFELNESEVSKAQEFLSRFGGIKYKLNHGNVDEATVACEQLFNRDLQVEELVPLDNTTLPGTVEQSVFDPPVSSLNDTVIENQDDMTSSASGESEMENVAVKVEDTKECELNGALCEDSSKTMEVEVRNGEMALNSSLLGSIDKGVGYDGIVRKISTRRDGVTQQVARKSTGCPQVTERSAKRARAAGGQQMEKIIDGVEGMLRTSSVEDMEPVEEMQNVSVTNGNGDTQSNVESEKVEGASNGEDSMEVDKLNSTNSKENGSQEEGIEKRHRKKNEDKDFDYGFKAPRRGRSRKSVSERYKSPSATGGKLRESQPSQKLGEILTEMGATKACTPEAKNGHDENNDQNGNADEQVAGPSNLTMSETLPTKFLRSTAKKASGI